MAEDHRAEDGKMHSKAQVGEDHTSLQARSQLRGLFLFLAGFSLCFALTHAGTVAQQPQRPVQGSVFLPSGLHATPLLQQGQISSLGKFRGEGDKRVLKR